MRRLTLVFGLTILCLATAQSSFIFAFPRGRGRGDDQSRQPSQEHPLDVSADVRLTVEATRDKYEQLEPIKLELELINLSGGDVTFEDVSGCELFGFNVFDVKHHLTVEDATRSARVLASKPSTHGPITIRAGTSRRFTAYPNLCIDMTVVTNYTIDVTMRLKRSLDGRRCLTKSKQIRVEVTPLSSKPR